MLSLSIISHIQLGDKNQSPLQQSAQIHLEAMQMVRDQATSVSQKAARDMIKSFNSRHPPAAYAIGSQVLVRRFSSHCRKRAGNKSTSKVTRVVKGTIVDRNLCNGTYKIHYLLNDHKIEEWFKVSDVTSLTLEEEKKKHIDSQKYKQKMSVGQLAQPQNSSCDNKKPLSSSEESCSPSSSRLLCQTLPLSSSPEEKLNSLQPTSDKKTSKGTVMLFSIKALLS